MDELLLRILGIAACGAVLTLLMRGTGRTEIAVICETLCGLLLLWSLLDLLPGVQVYVQSLRSAMSAENETLRFVFRITGIALLTELAAQLCRDAGAGTLGQRVTFCGKAVILCTALPLLQKVFVQAWSLLE